MSWRGWTSTGLTLACWTRCRSRSRRRDRRNNRSRKRGIPNARRMHRRRRKRRARRRRWRRRPRGRRQLPRDWRSTRRSIAIATARTANILRVHPDNNSKGAKIINDFVSRKDVLALKKPFPNRPDSIAIYRSYFISPSGVESLPAADVRLVVRGRWKRVDPRSTVVTFQCSECNYYAHVNATKFCPNCGADMRKNETAFAKEDANG